MTLLIKLHGNIINNWEIKTDFGTPVLEALSKMEGEYLAEATSLSKRLDELRFTSKLLISIARDGDQRRKYSDINIYNQLVDTLSKKIDC
jgi:hypothetical protein